MLNKIPKKLWYLLGITVLFKIIIGSSIELGNDEVYYYTYALQPDWNHFDHPPIVGFLIRFTTLNLHWLSDLSMRIGAIIGCAISTLFIYLTAFKIRNERTGWFAALMYNVSIYTGIISGLFILPDSPQMIFWTGAIYYIVSLLDEEETTIKQWLTVGILIGLAALCKVHGLYLWAGIGLFILICRRTWLLKGKVYVSGIISMLCLIPIIIWNIKNDFITYKFHSERVSNHSIKIDSFIQEFIGEMLYQNPLLFVLIIVSLIWIIKNRKTQINDRIILLLCLSLPMIGLFLGISLFNETLPHWSGPGYIPLYIIAAIYLDEKSIKANPVVLKIAGGLVVVVLIVGSLLANFASFNIGSKDWEHYGEYCPTLDISGWNNLGKEMQTIVADDVQKGKMKASSPILINKWFPAGHIEFYVATKTHQQVIATGKLEDVHKFAWLNKERSALKLGDDAYCIVPSNINVGNQANDYSAYFNTVSEPQIIPQMRGGKIVRYFKLYRLIGCKKLFPCILCK